jgi:UDP:flavonoid glycosyltransferase YjiC (YdhE family)
MTDAGHHALVIPAYNEAFTIRDVVAGALRHIARVIIVDDGSTDGTAIALSDLPVTVLRHDRNRGKGAALWSGIREALEGGATAIVTIDGDGQHAPQDIPILLAAHRQFPSGIIIGSRLHNRHLIPAARYAANRIANFWISWAAGRRLHDTQSGFRLYPAETMRSLYSACDWKAGFALESEILIEAGRRGIGIHAVPVSTVYGSHLRRSHFRQGRDISRITRMVAKKLLARRMDVDGLCRSLYASSSIPTKRRRVRDRMERSRGPVRVLFIAESVSLAHVARAATLARSLDPDRYDVHLACDSRYLPVLGPLPFPVHRISSIDGELFQDRLAKGDQLYSVDDLRGYVKEDLSAMENVQPDVVVGDFRLSLSVSARLAGIPYAAIVNAHWSPYARPRYRVPELAISARFGPRLGQLLFNLIRPFVFAQQAAPLNRVRREQGLAPLPYSLPHVFCDADATWYADLPELIPTFGTPPHHRYVGPVVWDYGERPWWWASLEEGRPTAYVTMGTSGMAHLTRLIVQALTDLRWQVLVATAGRSDYPRVREGLWVAPYLPGTAAAARADLVICNGGSGTLYQALAAGTPVLGLPSNLDQYLTMEYVRVAGAGELLRSGTATVESIQRMVRRIQGSATYTERARRLQQQLYRFCGPDRLDGLIAAVLSPGLIISPEQPSRVSTGS